MRLMIERIINISDPDGELGFDQIDQRIATIDVDDPSEWTQESLIREAYRRANMPEKSDRHRITQLGKSAEVSND